MSLRYYLSQKFTTPTNILLPIQIIVVLMVVAESTIAPSKLSLANCPSKCGNVDIPYPFGMGKGCYYSPSSDANENNYEITCNNTFNPPRPMYGNMEVLNIALGEGQITLSNYVAHACYDTNGTKKWGNYASLSLGNFTISTYKNVFAAIGCDTYGWFLGKRHGRNYSTGCMTMCDNPQDAVNWTCSGVGCCQTAVPDGVTNIDSISSGRFSNNTNVSSFKRCSSAFVVEKDVLSTFSLANLTKEPEKYQKVPVVLDWAIGTQNCAMAQANGNCLCHGNSTCFDSEAVDAGYRCKCSKGYSGNAYLINGCQDVDECALKHDCEKPGYCVNTIGNYTCQCPKGFHGLGRRSDRCIETFPTPYKVIVGVAGGLIGLIVIAVRLYCKHQEKQLRRARESFFRQNGGQFLHDKLSGRDVSVDIIKIFTTEDLEKATNKYTDSNIIGMGGFGIVYKGVLENNEEVAIKRSLKVDSTQSEQFINEVILLSQLNNRHVVKLLGCCLETEVPLLVYEFIDNGTLYDHLHDEIKASFLTWDIRLRIVSEVAEVLSYLHTTISIPIIHRDIKSTNILLDRNYTAKVSDFGASRLVPMDQDHLATVVLGTGGYLDPEYLQTSELTQKSDVYSFGVVLVEILTRERALSYRRPENERCLAIFFLRRLREHRLIEILDDKILKNDGAFEQVNRVADLAQRCLNLKGENRPTMKEVAMQLQNIAAMTGSHQWSGCSGKMVHEETPVSLGDTVRIDDDMNYSKGRNVMDSSSSQVISLLASIEYGR